MNPSRAGASVIQNSKGCRMGKVRYPGYHAECLQCRWKRLESKAGGAVCVSGFDAGTFVCIAF